MRAPMHHHRHRESGAAAVEFALVAPLVLLLVFGILSYGYMLAFRQAMSQGTAEGARAAAIAPPAMSETDRATRARSGIDNAISSYGVTCASTGVTCAVSFATCAGTTGRCASVTVRYPYRSGSVGPKFPGLRLALPPSLEFTSVVEVSP